MAATEIEYILEWYIGTGGGAWGSKKKEYTDPLGLDGREGPKQAQRREKRERKLRDIGEEG